MKINYKIFTILTLTSLMFVSCDDGDAIPDLILDETTSGAILRTVNVTSNELPIGVSDGFFGVDLEIQDEENGNLVNMIDVFATFRDNTPDNGVGATSEEALAESVPSSMFTPGDSGLPQLSYSITLPELLAATGVAEADIDGGDQFSVRFELVLNDGRRFSVADNTGTLTGAFFSSPFVYNATIVCPPTPPTAGDWTFDMADAFGDSWNGASLTVTLDGTPMEFLVDNAEGDASVETLTVPVGTQVISIIFNSGAFDGEVSYTITSASGNVIVSQEAYTTNPTAGVELINYCVQNF